MLGIDHRNAGTGMRRRQELRVAALISGVLALGHAGAAGAEPFKILPGDVPARGAADVAHFQMFASDVIEYSGFQDAAGEDITRNDGEEVRFRDQSSAADATIITNEGGAARFLDQSTAASAFITNNGETRFSDDAAAGDAAIVNNGAGQIEFADRANAGTSSIENSGALGFTGDANAGQATITNNQTGTITFSDTSSGGSNLLANSGEVRFRDGASAGDRFIANNETGAIAFEGSSTAGNAVISNSGSLVFSGDGTLDAGRIVNNAGSTTLFSGNATAASGEIANAAGLTFTDNASAASALILTQTGGTTIFSGNASGGLAEFRLEDGAILDFSGLTNGGTSAGSLLGTGRIYLGANELTVGGNDLMTTVGGISDGGIAGGTGGSLVKTGGATLRLEGDNTYTGRTLVRSGTLQAASENAFAPRSAVTVESGAVLDIAGFDQEVGSIAGSGTIDLAANTLTAGGDGESTRFDGVFTGAGGIAKTGAGTLRLTGDSPELRSAAVADGALLVDGEIISAAVEVDAGGLLGGSGRVGSARIADGARLAPGGSGTELGVAGNLTIADGGTLVAMIGASENSRVAAGTIDLAEDSRLELVAESGAATFGTYEILTAQTGLLTGEFGAVVSNFAFLSTDLIYTPDSLSVTFERNHVAFADLARTSNQRSTARGLESAGPGNGAFDAVMVLPDGSAVRDAFDQLAGDVHGSIKSALVEESGVLRDTMTARLDRDALAASGTDVWAQGFGSRTRGSGGGNAGDLDHASGGVLAGVDRDIAGGRAGLLVGWGSSSITVGSRRSSADVESLHAGVYGGYGFGTLALRAGAAISRHRVESERTTSFQGFEDSLDARYDARTLQAFAEAGYGMDVGSAVIEPFVNLAHVRTRNPAFSEVGGDAALDVAASRTDATFATLGLRTSGDLVRGGIPFGDWSLAAGWRHKLGGDLPQIDAAFRGGEAFSISGTPLARDAISVYAATRFHLTAATSLALAYSGEFGGGWSAHVGRIRWAYRF